jgi:hypothetical protein
MWHRESRCGGAAAAAGANWMTRRGLASSCVSSAWRWRGGWINFFVEQSGPRHEAGCSNPRQSVPL